MEYADLEQTQVFYSYLEHFTHISDFQKKYLANLQHDREAWQECLRSIMDSHGYSPRMLADLCGVTRPAVNRWLSGSIPNNRDKFIRIGFAAGYDLDGMNRFLSRYGKYSGLYAKSIEDSVYIFVLNSKHIPHTYVAAQEIFNQIDLEEDPGSRGTCGTGTLSKELLGLESLEELNGFLNKLHHEYTKEVLGRFYDRVLDLIAANSLDMADGRTFSYTLLAQDQGWSTSLWRCVSEIRNRRWIPRREKVIALALHLNTNRDEINQLLQMAHMEPLCPMSPIESSIIFALLDAEREGIISSGDMRTASTELCDHVRDILERLHVPDTEPMVQDILVERAKLVCLERGRVSCVSLSSKTRWLVGRRTDKNQPDIPLHSDLVGRQHGLFCRCGEDWFYRDCGSVNGTFLNGRKLPAAKGNRPRYWQLKDGDVLRIDYEDLDMPDPDGVWMLFTVRTVPGHWKAFPLDGHEPLSLGRKNADLHQRRSYLLDTHAKLSPEAGGYRLTACPLLAEEGWERFPYVRLNGEILRDSALLREKDWFDIGEYNFIYTNGALIYNDLPKSKRQNR